ncbi:MAG: AAA family ATPase, partial [Xanthobacteraceae bacterium]|nr:AAA family ATPase [Xanthobacteraceae bacterium]
EPAEAWRVVAEAATVSRFEALRGAGLAPLVGREEELELLLRRWAQAKAGTGRVVLVGGEPGIGKSRLARALQDAIAGEPHVELRLFCSPHHQDSALYPHIAQLVRAAGLARDDADEARLAKLDAVLAQSDATDEAVALIAELLSIPTDQRERVQQMNPETRRERTLAALLAQLSGLATRKPVLLIYEDLHWIDPTSRELLDRTIEHLEHLPVLLLATFRPEFQPPWAGQANVTSLALTRLDRRDTTAMIAGIAGAKGLPAGVAQEIAERTDGVPLFIEETTKAVMESGPQAVEASPSVPHPTVAVPATLHASLSARLDRLGPAAREVAQKGAVIGREFGHDLLASIADLPEPRLREALDRLANSGLLFTRGVPPKCTYIFKHALVQDVAYGTLLRGRRQDLHARTGAALETRFRETIAAQPELLAHHFTEARLIEHAVQYCLKGGQQALARSTMAEAEALLRRGLRLLPHLPEGPRLQHELELHIALAPVLTAVQGPGAPAAFEANFRARQLCDELNRADKLLSPLSGLWLYHYVQGDLERAQQLAHEMRQLGELRNDLAMRFTARRAGGTVCFVRGELAAARSELEEALALYDPAQRASLALAISSVDPLVDVLSVLAGTLACEGHLEEARSRCEAALGEARRLSHAHTLGFALIWACLACWIPRWHTRVLQFAEELIALAEERKFPYFHLAGRASRGWCLTTSGQAEKGIPLLSRASASADMHGIAALTVIRPMLADAHAKAGHPQVALGCVADWTNAIAATRAELFLSEALRLKAELLVVENDCTTAEVTLRNAIAVAQRQ